MSPQTNPLIAASPLVVDDSGYMSILGINSRVVVIWMKSSVWTYSVPGKHIATIYVTQ